MSGSKVRLGPVYLRRCVYSRLFSECVCVCVCVSVCVCVCVLMMLMVIGVCVCFRGP